MTNFCYILVNKVNNKTYVGYTNDPDKRLRQHNGELCGGAKYTTRQCGNWCFLMLIQGITDLTKNQALSLEWWLKHPEGRRKTGLKYVGSKGRILSSQVVLSGEKFKNHDFIVYINTKYLTDFNEILGGLANVNLHLLENYCCEASQT